jgi:predicted  nucleic acid-binding Zn-ribbon protein
MPEPTESLVLEHLRHMRSQLDRVDDGIQDLKRRISSLELQVSTLHGDFAGQSMRIDRIEERLGRIEKRLGLIDA